MKKSTIFGIAFAVLAASPFYFSCEKNNTDRTVLDPIYDCPDIEKNVGDSCISAAGGYGTIDSACNCIVAPVFDCPALQLDFGDPCQLMPGTPFGTLDSNCNCAFPVTFDCPALQANYGDACVDANGNAGIISTTCNCEPAPPSFDCPNYQGNFGDPCTGMGLVGIINGNCNCVQNAPFDCPTLWLNVGDPCPLSATQIGTVNSSCECQ